MDAGCSDKKDSALKHLLREGYYVETQEKAAVWKSN